ncbi:hypothetical protein CKO28_00205 [Rhodovibrio sodomensis]|uniref:Uncharacterized protein n=1 Tax=Rhodovibrio sodomensis TaxID=1088 RepID=A0ABS1D911_9PROT|nr:hypothetical protein [Rhodovibrio sodomensis]MBK1666461.1 hypothetical protein [Rhodovibrio sodomensis]
MSKPIPAPERVTAAIFSVNWCQPHGGACHLLLRDAHAPEALTCLIARLDPGADALDFRPASPLNDAELYQLRTADGRRMFANADIFGSHAPAEALRALTPAVEEPGALDAMVARGLHRRFANRYPDLALTPGRVDQLVMRTAFAEPRRPRVPRAFEIVAHHAA